MIESIVAVSWTVQICNTPKTCFDKYGNRLIFLLITVDNTNFLLSLAKFYLFKKEKNPVFFRRITNGFFIFLILEQGTGRRQNIFTFQTDLKINRATISPWIGIMTGEFCNDFVILWSKYWNKLLLFQQKLSRILIFFKFLPWFDLYACFCQNMSCQM